ncbi:MAG: ABC transporter permease [Pyrinomonadaceae bacterium]
MISLAALRESAVMAVDTLLRNKLRSSLTVLGVTVGVVTVLAMVSIIQGLNRSFSDQIESLGSNTIFVTKFDPSFGRQPGAEERQRKELTIDDAHAIEQTIDTVASVTPIQRELSVTLRYRDRQSDTTILIGTTPSYEFTYSQYISYGRFIIDSDLRERTDVAVLGQDVIKALFRPDEDPIGAAIKIDGRPFKVVGVMSVLGSFFGQSRDNIVFIPLTTAQKYYPRIESPQTVFAIVIRPRTRADVPRTIDEVTDLLRTRRQVKPGEKNNFGITSQDALLDIYNQLTGATYLVLTAISAVALMIGGIGVMNIMLVSVTERTKEIGIRKAVGATRASVLSQFLNEAMCLTAVGGALGIAIGEILSVVINRYSPLPAYIPLWAILLGLVGSAGVGIVFGVFPAYKAANLDPIEALRFE